MASPLRGVKEEDDMLEALFKLLMRLESGLEVWWDELEESCEEEGRNRCDFKEMVLRYGEVLALDIQGLGFLGRSRTFTAKGS